MKTIRVRPRADTEINRLAAHIARDNLGAALRFLDAVEQVFNLVAQQPKIGSQRYSHIPKLEKLRVCAVSGFEKYLVFYNERQDYIDVIRVLHSARDLPSLLIER